MIFSKEKFKNLVLISALSAVALCGCGGGGGDSGTGGETSNPAPDSSGTLNPGLTGRIWFKDQPDSPIYTISDARTGVETRAAALPSTSHTLKPSPDGKIFVSWFADPPAEQDDDEPFYSSHVNIYDATQPFDKNKPLFTTDFSGYITSLHFSPDGRYVGILYGPQFVSRHSNAGFKVYDLINPKLPVLVRDFPTAVGEDPDTVVVNLGWISNTKYLYLLNTNKLVAGDAQVAGGNDKNIGALEAPTGFNASADMSVSPDGTQIAVAFSWFDGPLKKRDIWVTDIDGKNPQRVSDDHLTGRPFWSPDSQYIAMESDTGYSCISGPAGGACIGSCNTWYLPRTARNAKMDRSKYIRSQHPSYTTGFVCQGDMSWTK